MVLSLWSQIEGACHRIAEYGDSPRDFAQAYRTLETIFRIPGVP